MSSEAAKNTAAVTAADQRSLERVGRLALRYVLTSLGFFFLGGLAAWAMRLQVNQVVHPNATLYDALMTGHGLVMFLGFAGMSVMGASLYVVARAFQGRLRSFVLAEAAYWLMTAGCLEVLIATVFMNFGASWVFLYPLAYYPAGAWSPAATFVFELGVVLIGLSIIAYGLVSALTATLPRPEDPGRPWPSRLAQAVGLGYLFPGRFGGRDYPLVAVPLAVNGIDMVIATSPLALLLIENLLQVFIPSLRVDPLLAKNVLWFFGHPVVYLLLFPAVAVAYHIVAEDTKRSIPAGPFVGFAWALALVVNISIWAHHIYIDFPNATSQAIVNTIAEPLTYSVTLPSVVSIVAIVVTFLAAKPAWGLPMKFTIAAVFSWLVAGFSGIVNATPAMDETVHNTMWVVGHFHNMALLNIGFVAFAGAYYLVPKLTGRGFVNRHLGNVHLWGSVVGGYLMVLPWMLQGLEGLPRRVITTPNSMDWLNWIFLVGLAVFTVVQLAFAWNLFQALRGPQVKTAPVAA
jgi:cytochrome c oxidase subunit 1